MRLKDLNLLGYKSFAARTEFAFGPGITAIVGPNGSGKSNIADAILWVLGEQSLRLLRGRRTEDMIFSGSEARSRVGMAEASLTFSNEEGWLPIEYQEITITRRAYRSGDNEYLLNGNRVRLRDIQDLLAPSGLGRRSYTVIGQGLVDAALSLRPEERRILIEDAAGLSGYQDRRKAALTRLEATQANLLRTQDILQELAPRVQRLERQAERAQEHARLSQELVHLLRISYGYRWGQAQQALRSSRQRLAKAKAVWQEAQARVDEQERKSAEIRLQMQTLRQALSEWHRESSLLHQELENTQRESAVLQERSEHLARQTVENQKEIQNLQRTRQVRQERVAELRQELEAHENRLRQQQDQVQAAERELQEEQIRQASHQAEILRLSQEIETQRSQQQDRLQELAQLESRMAHGAQEAQRHGEAAANLECQKEVFGEKVQDLEHQGRELAALRTDLARQKEHLERHLATLRDQIAQGHKRLSALQAAQDRLGRRLDDLRREREEMAGLFPGVRAVLRAAGPGEALKGIIGTVASQIQVPNDLERALEAALGSHLQDVLVHRWADAERAITFLKESQAGRVTFLPLDSLRPPQPLRPPSLPGLLGLASDLVSAQEALAPAVQLLLNRTLVVEDLATGRHAFERLQGGFQIVTRAGEIIRSTGAVTGGASRGWEKGLLAREGEWRRLPDELKDAHKATESARRDLERLHKEQEATLAALSAAEEDARHLARKIQALQNQQSEEETRIQTLERERAWHLAQKEALEAQRQQWATSLQQVEREVQAGQEVLEYLESQLAELQATSREDAILDLSQKVSFLQAQRQVIEGDRSATTRIVEALQQELTSLNAQLKERESRSESLRRDQERLEQQLAALRAQEESLSPALHRLQEQIGAAEQEVRELDDRFLESSRQEREVRRSLREREESLSQATLEMQRQEDRLRHLREQIERDLGLVEVEPANGLPEQPPLPLRPLVSSLPSVAAHPEGLEDEIKRLQGQISRLGPINTEAPAEYEALRKRYEFLESQSQDLQKAVGDLHQIIAELDELMEREFERTFHAVNDEFKTFFRRLFGGGAARLVLTQPDDLTHTGIEIMAQPPGKRQQTLALLSGGERALTAVALIFAILQTSPTPFCVLDEVDAMLDEANIGRFREVLVELSRKTQFIVISHNRKTIEAAHRLYGVSMRRDGSSQVVSLRIDEEESSQIAA